MPSNRKRNQKKFKLWQFRKPIFSSFGSTPWLYGTFVGRKAAVKHVLTLRLTGEISGDTRWAVTRMWENPPTEPNILIDKKEGDK